MPHGSTCYSGTKIMEKIRLSEGLVSSFYFIALLTPVHCFAYFSAQRPSPLDETVFTSACNDLYQIV